MVWRGYYFGLASHDSITSGAYVAVQRSQLWQGASYLRGGSRREDVVVGPEELTIVGGTFILSAGLDDTIRSIQHGERPERRECSLSTILARQFA